MVEDIIKAVNHQFVYVSHTEFEKMLLNCQSKLLACSCHNEGSFKAFFDCPKCNEDQLIQLLDLCCASHTLFMGFVQKKEKKEIYVYSNRIHAGEQLVFNSDVIITQSIPSDCFIECYGNLYVIGEIQGCVDLHYEHLTCVASSLKEARIRIFDSEFHKMTSFSSCSLYYENQGIKKEEQTWEVVLGLHPEKVA